MPQAGVGKIVFASNRDGLTQIYMMNADGGGQTSLSDNSGNDDNPRWSPQGSTILFQSDRDNPETGNNDIYVMNVGATGRTRLTTDPNDDSAASWSPDGTKIAFQSLRSGMFYQVYSMNVDGSNQVNLSNSGASDGQPSWSPDGRKIAFASDRDHAGYASIYVMNADGSGQTRLTWGDAPFRDEQPVWSPDGTRLAFTSTRDSVIESWQETDEEGGVVQRSALRINREVYVMNADGSSQVRLTDSLGNDDSPSWSPDGSQIVFRSDRERDCCDPTSQVWVMSADGTGQVNLSGNAFGDYSASWSVISVKAPPSADEASASQANSGTINFDNLQSGTVVLDQYRPYATFSTVGFSGGYNYYDSYPNLFTYANNVAPGGSYPNGIITTNPLWVRALNFDVYVDFLIPVNNLKFKLLNSVSTYRLCYIDIFVDHHYQTTYQYFGNGTRAPILADLSSLPRITGIHIYSVSNGRYVTVFPYTEWVEEFVIYDDFTFTPDININITNSRVSGNLQGQTKKALIGADVTLNAEANRGGGTYSWDVAGPKQIVSTSSDGKTIVVRWTEPGTYKVTSSYKLNGITVSSDINVNVVMPTLSSFVGTQGPDHVKTWDQCPSSGILYFYPYYTVGCLFAADPDYERGITFNATVQIPNDTYLSDPAQSGVKFVQVVSAFRKLYALGNVKCRTTRNHDLDTTKRNDINETTGWLLDSGDPYSTSTVKRFSAGNVINAVDSDTPSTYLGEAFIDEPGLTYGQADAFYGDDQFEMYLVYFTGGDPSAPIFQKPLALASAGADPNAQVAYVPWRANAGVLFGNHSAFQVSCPPANYQNGYCLNSYNYVGPIAARSKSSMRTYSGKVQDLNYGPCPWPYPTSKLIIDTPRFFVQQQYKDFLGRDPLPGDAAGLDHWRADISMCGFDLFCVQGMRVNVAKAFFYADEFIGTVPGLNAAYRGTDSYNREFVRQCYYRYLRRTKDPETYDAAGFKYWVDKLNAQYQTFGDAAYNEMIKSFIESIEYRERPDFPSLPVPVIP